MHVARFDQEPNRGALFAVYLDVGERRNAREFNARRRNESARNRNRLDGLVKSTGSDCLDLGGTLLANDTGECARIRCAVWR